MSFTVNKLKYIEISGFKSFAKKSVLEFRTPITAVVGPNGSGKSNVAEAFSFVLGEQSIKSLRGKKGEDLIYNGSATGTRANRASVKVIFDNHSSTNSGPSERLLDVDFDEVSIERMVHRDGVNQYSINGSQARLKDIIELLAGANIGSTGHHIISQGEADRVLSVNSKERRAIIEDALGLKIYQIKRRESERKLERTEENIKQVGSLRKEIKPHLNFLKKQAEKIENTLLMREDLKEMYKEYFKRENTYLESQKNYIEKESREPKEKLSKIEEDIEKLQKEVNKEKDPSKESSRLTKIEEEINEIVNKKGELILELGRFEGELRSLKKILGENMGSKKELQVPYQQVKSFLDDLKSKIDSLKSENDIGVLKEVLSRIKGTFDGFLSKYFDEENKETDFSGDIESLKEKVENTNSEIDELSSKETELRKGYEELRSELDKEKDSSIEAERKIFDLKTEKNELLMRLNEIEVLKDRVEYEEDEYKRELTSAAILAGREVLEFEKISLKNDEGVYVTKEDMAEEKRSKQEDRRKDIEKIKIRLEDAGGASGEEIIKEFNEVRERDEFLEKEVDDLDKSAKSLKEIIKDLENKLDKEFDQGLGKINKQFQEFFSLMFGGGNASLRIVREKSPKPELAWFNHASSGGAEESNIESEVIEGVEIEVNLPKKKIKGLMMLSGGERALTSIALIFAMSQVKPPPFIILDETDAALDEANSRKYGDMIRDLSKHSQLILITHNRETMSRAGVLYGVTMGADGISKLLSVDLEEAVEVAK